MSNQLGAIDTIVVLMLENRSFDQMLGLLYTAQGNQSPSGQAFDGLAGTETNPDSSGNPVSVFPITSATPNAYVMPGADPGEGYLATNSQLFGSTTVPVPPVATNGGFVTDFDYTLGWQQKTPGWSIVSGTTATDIMGIYSPQMLPVLTALAEGYAVCDQWFSSVPTETMPNRAFACAGTSQGHMNDDTKTFTTQSIFGLLSQSNLDWRIYGYVSDPMTPLNFPDLASISSSRIGKFADFQAAAAAGTLPSYTFLEPDFSATGNSQHPNYNVAAGEALIQATYTALRNGPAWNTTLFILTYDEHGGCFDHVNPPSGAIPPDALAGEYGFDFTRFGVRVPTVLISPWIPAGTVFRVPAGSTPLDHTSIPATVEHRFGLKPLTARDAAAPDVGDALTATVPRTDNPLEGVTAPALAASGPESQAALSALPPSHLQKVHAQLAAELPVAGHYQSPSEALAGLVTTADYKTFIDRQMAGWKPAQATKATKATKAKKAGPSKP
jgi:phospholipase C